MKKEGEASTRMERRRDWAHKQGLVLVRLSPRRYVVARLCSGGAYFAAADKNIAYLGGEVVLGPASYEECRRHIAETVEPIPENFLP